MLIDPRTTNSLWASVLVETLRRCGLRHVVISPGSRSTPLTLAFAAQPEIEAIPVLDERSAAFFALGLAKERNRPVALLCTSGTAAANYFPALIEAHESGVPLLVLTADRPPEMRACASGQTIDQQKLFGGFVTYYHELAVPVASEAMLRYVRQTLIHATERSLQPAGGPVHLNIPFRDPLVPVGENELAAGVAQGIDWEHFFAHVRVIEPNEDSGAGLVPHLVPEVHGVIVVGPEQRPDPDAFTALVAALARKLGWPVITDGLSPLRNFGDAIPHCITTADTILRHASAAERLAPEVVLCVGGWPTSKVLRGWIEASGARVFLQSSRVDNRDALHVRTQRFQSLLPLVQGLPELDEPNGYQRVWAGYERKARAALDARLGAMSDLFEGKATWLLAQHLPEETPLMLANSMPVRDLEYFWPPNARRVRPLCNRGANGIDGTLSTAFGIAHSSGKPTVLLTGDLALLHDTNGFLLRPKFHGSLTIVLINNRGGGIFEHLPIAQFEPPFEEFFATPQEADFELLCRAYGVSYTLVRDWAHYTEIISTLPAHGVRVVELRTDRKRDAAMRKEWFAAVASSLG